MRAGWQSVADGRLQQSCVMNPGLGMIGSPIMMSSGMDQAELIEKSERVCVASLT